jgi:radical SAM superfamily enzyme YgiQ (UPF0313 family)
MKIALISPFPTLSALGIRGLSSWLKQNGHQVKVFHMARPSLEFTDNAEYLLQYPENAYNQLADLCSDCQLIGISLFTQHYEGAINITDALKKRLPSIPIIWGGIHPTVKPDECIEHADFICRGEGEESLLELVTRMEKGGDLANIPGIWARKGNLIFKNPEWPLVEELDKYPIYDYGTEGHYLYLEQKEQIVPMTWELQRDHMDKDALDSKKGSHGKGILYSTLGTRGCPLNCTYCCNNAYRKLYAKQKYVRHRNIEHIISELVWVRENMPWVTMVCFEDDSFLAASIQEIQEFAKLYKEKVGLPFRCLHEPLTFTQEKMDALLDAGLVGIQMGIETAAPNTLKMYNRGGLGKKIMEAAKILADVSKTSQKPFYILYDLIIDNPWETDEDLLETVKFVVELPGNFHLNIFSLVFYPGTELYERAKQEGLLTDETKQIYRKTPDIKKQTYISFLLMLLKKRVPRPILRPLVHPRVVKVLNHKGFHWIYQSIFKAIHILRQIPQRSGI